MIEDGLTVYLYSSTVQYSTVYLHHVIIITSQNLSRWYVTYLPHTLMSPPFHIFSPMSGDVRLPHPAFDLQYQHLAS